MSVNAGTTKLEWGRRLQNPESKFRKCDEFHTAPCDPEPTDTCCAVVSCVYCLTWTYGGEIKNRVAKFVVNSWVGVVDNRSLSLTGKETLIPMNASSSSL